MIPKTLIALAVAAIAVTLDAAPASVQAQRYILTDLGSVHGCCFDFDVTVATGINNAGDVVGSVLLPLGAFHPAPFIYRNGTLTVITTASGSATAINNSGQVTGYIQRIGNFNQEAFLYDGTLHRLGGLPRHSRDGYSIGNALNNAGVVVGESGGMTRHAPFGVMVYANGLMVSTNYRDARIAYGVNDSGAIVGIRATDTLTHAFLFDRHGFRDLGTLDDDPATASVAHAINASGVVVGYSTIAGDLTLRAFAYSNGVMRNLGVRPALPGVPPDAVYSSAFAINTAGDIVGESSGVAFLYRDGTMSDLNEAIDHDEAGFPRLLQATGINDRGQIVGNAMFGDSVGRRAFLLTPVSPPE